MNQPAAGPDRNRKPRVVVVFGGRSSEHAISCVTAGGVLRVIDPGQYDVVPVGIAPDGRWHLQSGDPSLLEMHGSDRLPSVDATGPLVSLVPAGDAAELVVTDADGAARSLGRVDVVFPLLHGPWGEDGTIQGQLELAGVRYVGAGVLASAVGMDKAYLKVLLQAAGLPVLPWVVLTAREWAADPQAVRERVAALGFPVFVKPARAGSSMGIGKAHDLAGLDACVTEALEHDPKVVVEASAEGAREIECGVLGATDGPAQASVPGEIRVSGAHEFYDFAAKYLPEEATQLDVPADLAAGVVTQVQDLAVRAFASVDCEGLARVDFFLMPDGALIVNEINTMPGFTPLSMFPRMWAATGLDYPQLVDRLLRLALTRDTGLR